MVRPALVRVSLSFIHYLFQLCRIRAYVRIHTSLIQEFIPVRFGGPNEGVPYWKCLPGLINLPHIPPCTSWLLHSSFNSWCCHYLFFLFHCFILFHLYFYHFSPIFIAVNFLEYPLVRWVANKFSKQNTILFSYPWVNTMLRTELNALLHWKIIVDS